jgi:predicted alpha/beta-fold hydrolase
LVVLVHGISGSESSCYMSLAAAFFLARGYPVLRVNQRGAGPSRPLCRREYHAGSSNDLKRLFEKLDPGLTCHGLLPIGFSLGGNALLKFLGTSGRHLPVKRAAAVSAPMKHGGRAISRWSGVVFTRRPGGVSRFITYHLPTRRGFCRDG